MELINTIKLYEPEFEFHRHIWEDIKVNGPIKETFDNCLINQVSRVWAKPR